MLTQKLLKACACDGLRVRPRVKVSVVLYAHAITEAHVKGGTGPSKKLHQVDAVTGGEKGGGVKAGRKRR
jgi:hypothetical protein